MNSTAIAKRVLCFFAVCFVCFCSLMMKNAVQELEKELNSINSEIQNDVKNIHVLKAEWSHLNTPARLRKLVKKHISLNPLQAEQIINYSALPFDYEKGESRKRIARRSISNYAEQKRGLKRLTSAQR